MAARKLRLLGEFELKSASGLRLRTRKAEALLAYLALPAGPKEDIYYVDNRKLGDVLDQESWNQIKDCMSYIKGQKT